MPIYLEPDNSFPVVLESDMDKQPQPKFWVRTQSMRGQRQIAVVLDMIEDEGTTTPALFDATLSELERVIAKTENMPSFELDSLTYTEARELLRKVMYNQKLDHETKKA